jgi:hypothetical protein
MEDLQNKNIEMVKQHKWVQQNDNKCNNDDDRLWHLWLFYNGAFSIASKNDLDDQNLLLATKNYLTVCQFINK